LLREAQGSDLGRQRKILVAFPEVLELMDHQLEWTQKLGDAVLAQEKELLDAVQRLRARAQAEGTSRARRSRR
jgi:hypothetical protein